MKKTIHLYILKEIAVPFLLGMATFTSVLLMGRLLRLADMVVAKGVPVTDILRLVLYLLPIFCLVTIPMAFLLAILLAFGRLSADSEIIAMKSGGISIYGLLPPVFAFAFFAYISTAFITIQALPWGHTAFKKLGREIAQSRADMALKERVFIDGFPGIAMYLDHYDQQKRIMGGILIHDERNPSEPVTIFAEAGKIAAGQENKTLRLQLSNGSIHRALDKESYRLIRFKDYDLSINIAPQPSKETDKSEIDMTFEELRKEIASAGVDPRRMRDMKIEFHRRFSLPFACFVFALIGVPLGIQNQRSGKAAGFSLSIGVILVYYILFSIGKTLGERGILHPAVAVWTPNLIFTLLGIQLLRSTAAERSMKIFDQISRLTKRLRRHGKSGEHT